MIIDPLDPFSEVVDPNRRWTPEWYSWLKDFTSRVSTSAGGFGGPSTDNAIARFDGVGGLLQDSGVLISDTDVLGGAKVQPNGAPVARLLESRFADFVNVKDFGAQGDQVTDDTAAIQAAIDSIIEFGAGAVYFPAGFYKVLGSGTEALLINNRQVKFFGDGQGASGIFWDTSVPNTRDMIAVTSDSTIQGFHFHDLSLLCFGKGRHALNLRWTEASGTFAYQVEIENMFISQSETGASIRLQGVAYSSVSRCNLNCILIVEGGDGLTIRENVIGSTIAHCIDGDFVVGAGGFVVTHNVIAGTMGHVVLRRAVHPTISFNEFETPVGQANTYGFLIDIGVTTGVLSPTLVGNGYSILPGSTDPIAIRIRDDCLNTQIAETRIMNQGTVNHIQIDTGAEDTKIDRNGVYALGATIGEVQVSDSGTRTGYKQYFADGTASNPSISFLSDRSTGFYLQAAGVLTCTISGTAEFSVASTGVFISNDIFLGAGSKIDWNSGGVTITEVSDTLQFSGASNGYNFTHFIAPNADDAAALGIAGGSWSDLFLAEGGVINWDSGDVTLTQSGNSLTVAGGNLIFPGTATNDNAAAGQVGEYISSIIVQASAVSLTTATNADVTSISLTAGDWDVSGEVWYLPAGSTTASVFLGWISTVSATTPGDPANNVGLSVINVDHGAGRTPVLSISPMRVSVNTTTTVYLSTFVVFAVSTMKGYGKISARRVR